MDMYDKVYKIVAPKKAKLEAAEKEFAEMMEMLTSKRAEVQRLQKQLAELNEKLSEAVHKQKELQDSVDLCNNKLYRAQKLIGGLGGWLTSVGDWKKSCWSLLVCRWREDSLDCLRRRASGPIRWFGWRHTDLVWNNFLLVAFQQQLQAKNCARLAQVREELGYSHS